MVLNFDLVLVVELIALGLVAGTLGGMLGVGGSVILIPGLTVILGYNQHLFQATAMILNVVVSVPAATRHYRAGAMDGRVLRWMVPTTTVFVVVGVWVSNFGVFRGAGGGIWLGRVLAVFLLYVVGVNVYRMVRPRVAVGEESGGGSICGAGVGGGVVGVVMGTVAGLLGVGGGAIAVPLQQFVLRLPLRVCIANSSAVICVSAVIGSLYKNASLGMHGYSFYHSLSLAIVLAPSGWLGGHLGAGLTHSLPERQVRVAFICLIAVAAFKMAAIF